LAVPGRGSVRLGERVVSRDGHLLVPPEDRNLAVVFQDLALWPHLTVEGNLAFGLSARGVRGEERSARVAAMLRRVGLDGAGRRRPGDLSGGQRQRVAIARALVLEPSAVLLDEPLANVDVDLKRELLSLLRELVRERGATVLHVTHDLREAAALARRFAVLEGGRLAQEGGLAELTRAPATPFVRALVEDFETGGSPAAPVDTPSEGREP
ncbi:MAG TPA: ATP-binding cassette domain-containing protein, partial [Vicinamibacteria bacterium]